MSYLCLNLGGLMSKKHTTTFLKNMSLPIHRWFRYSAGFSAEWVESLIEDYIDKNQIEDRSKVKVFDPFSGSATVLISSEKTGVKGYGTDAHPFVSKVASAKLAWRCDLEKLDSLVEKINNYIKTNNIETEEYPELILKCYDEKTIENLHEIKTAINYFFDNSSEMKLIWLAFVSILRNTSHVGTAQWQYVLPNKKKIRVKKPFDAFKIQLELMIEDIKFMEQYREHPKSEFYNHDIRKPLDQLENQIDLVITSPPYANNFDYGDATRLEMTFLGDIKKWGDLQETVRKYLVPSCTQQVGKFRKETFEILENKLLSPIYSEILDVCKELEIQRNNRAGQKNYHTMIAMYFVDLAKIFINLRKVCKEGATVCFVVGDSAPYGVHVPLEEWLGKLAISAGFKEYRFEKLKDRNNRWETKNKHKVKLHEGRLWIRG